jgi:formamidopyrimidine-DNA glycosylase
MPELPEVEVLKRHLTPLVRGRTIRNAEVFRARVLASTTPAEFRRTLRGATFVKVSRRGKYLLFELSAAKRGVRIKLTGHLGMTGRMYLLPAAAPLPKHAAVVLNLGREKFVFEDTRYFGRFTLGADTIANLGPEPLGKEFTVDYLIAALKRSVQAIKVRLLDQRLVAGIGNIYASEALFRAKISPRLAARRLTRKQIGRLHRAIRETLAEAIAWGSTVPLNYSGSGERDGLFYFGGAGRDGTDFYEERLRVYNRAGRACPKCRGPIRRFVQAARSTFYCPRCQGDHIGSWIIRSEAAQHP